MLSVNSLEVFDKLLVANIVVAVLVNSLVKHHHLFVSHLHLQHSGLVFKLFESNSFARVRVHHLEDSAETQISSLHVVFYFPFSRLKNLYFISSLSMTGMGSNYWNGVIVASSRFVDWVSTSGFMSSNRRSIICQSSSEILLELRKLLCHPGIVVQLVLPVTDEVESSV